MTRNCRWIPNALFLVSLLAFVSTPLDAQEAVQPPKADSSQNRNANRLPALTDQGVSNLIVLTRLMGYIRHFHPSDEAAAVDWNRFSVRVVDQVENAGSPAELARRLQQLFGPVAPALRIFVTGAEPALTPELLPSGDLAELKVRFWEHYGYGQEEKSESHRSERVEMPARIALTEPLNHPTNVFRAELGGGLSCVVPMAVFQDTRGTLPRGALEPMTESPGDAVRYSPADRSARLASVALAWNVLQHFYPYFDDIEADWPGALRITLRAAATNQSAQAFVADLNKMMAQLHDGHGHVWTTNRSVPGTELPLRWQIIEKQLVITALPEQAPDGLRVGDLVESINGRPALDALRSLHPQICASSEQWRDVRAPQLLSRDLTQAALGLRACDGQRKLVEVHGVTNSPPRAARPPMLHEIQRGIWYVDTTRLTQREFDNALTNLSRANGLVFDVRGYPRLRPQWLAHLTRQPLLSQRWLHPVWRRPDRLAVRFEEGDLEDRWNVQPAEPMLTTNRVFLTDGGAISYAESTLGIVQHYRLGRIVGETTAATNGDTANARLPAGYSITWTGLKAINYDGSRYHGVGVAPDVPRARTLRGICEGRDEQLEEALKLLSRGRPD